MFDSFDFNDNDYNAELKAVVVDTNCSNKFGAKVAHLATDLAYKIAKGIEKYQEYEAVTIENLKNEGWKVLCRSLDNVNLNKNGYKAVALVKDESKEVLIAIAGTVPTDLNDLKDDFYIATGSFPSKVTEAKAMISHVAELLGSDVHNYTFNTSGHSLGAILSDVTAFEIMSKGLKLGRSITFDSPGSKNSIKEAIQSGVFSKDANVTVDDLKEHCTVYNVQHNFINYNPLINSPHITDPVLVLLKTKPTDLLTEYTTESGILGYTSYLVSKVSSGIIKTCSSYLGINKIATELERVKGHSLKNFADLDKKVTIDTYGWGKNGGTLFIRDFEGSDYISSTGHDCMSEKIIEDGSVVISMYSYNDLERANDCNKLLSGDNEDLADYYIIN
jgi:hypothetical protein